jgi:filamentous hemagglutinin family protein
MAWGRRISGQALPFLASFLAATTFLTPPGQANPTGGTVAAGQATIAAPSTTSTVITQGSQKAIINWSSFSIPSGSAVQVNQPGVSAVLLNRVPNGPASYLNGRLSANGQVYLINPAGIVVGSGAQISAAQVLLSTAGIGDANFLAGNLRFDQPGQPGAGVTNHGTITATGGAAILAGEQVRNDGVIVAALGTVVLGAAKTYAIDFTGDGLLKFAVTAPVDQAPADGGALVANSGMIAAPGGTVLLTAAAAKGVLDNVINTSGIVEATSVAQQDGKIVLMAAGGGASVGGTLDASGKSAGETGGQVSVLGDSVTLAAGARLDVSGAAGGGTALVGGNFHGAGPEPNAQATTVAPGASIVADALTSGDGGKVAVWSDGTTRFDGSISARGGAQGGNGGFVETSGAQQLYVTGAVDARAPVGTVGAWLTDPTNYTIAASGGDETGAHVASSVETAERIIQASGDITVSDPIVYDSNNQLTFLAMGSFIGNASVENLASGELNVIVGWDGSSGLTNDNTAFSIQALNGVPNSFGQNSPSITLGSSTVVFRSQQGTTIVSGASITIPSPDSSPPPPPPPPDETPPDTTPVVTPTPPAMSAAANAAVVSLGSVPPPASAPPPPPPPAVVTIAPPPPSSSGSTTEAPPGGTPAGGLASVTALDPSSSALPAGGSSGKPPEAVADVQPVKAATQALAKPPSASQAIGGFGSNLFQTKSFVPRPRGVPGLDHAASSSGNRSLWFASGGI